MPRKKPVIDPARYGVTFSVKQCRNFGLDSTETLGWLINEAGFRRFRLMSYWNEIEEESGQLDFTELDRQIEQIQRANGIITLCLGVRQPRWPENHWPNWAWQAPKPVRDLALLKFIEAVVNRYKDCTCIVSYQLENEALLEAFGERPEVDRRRLRQEFSLVKALDPDRPIIMSTSTSWGVPLRQPIPDIVGFSYYQVVYDSKRQRYTTAFHKPWLHRGRSKLISSLHERPTFIHELQLEPWGPTAIWKMTPEQQDESMGPAQITTNLSLAERTQLWPIDLWGGEWWYWRLKKQNDPSIWETVRQSLLLQ